MDNEESDQNSYIGDREITSLNEFEELVQYKIDHDHVKIDYDEMDEFNICKELIQLWTNYGYKSKCWTASISVETKNSYIR